MGLVNCCEPIVALTTLVTLLVPLPYVVPLITIGDVCLQA